MSDKRRRDTKLMCDGCKFFTTHCYAGTQPIGIKIIDVLYECTRCGANRVYGREYTGEIPEDHDDNESNTAA